MSLWSFEGEREPPAFDNLGGHSDGGTPLPIPNREVKPARADGTRGASPRESRLPPSIRLRESRPSGGSLAVPFAPLRGPSGSPPLATTRFRPLRFPAREP